MQAAIRTHLERDPILKDILLTTTLPELEVSNDLYNSLIRSIVYQQLSGKAAGTIHGRFLALFDSGYPHAEQVLSYELPALRAVGLSRQKSTYIQNVARFFLEHHPTIPDWERWSDEELIQHFTQIKGVGKWTVQMILMSALGRTDIFPLDDLGIQQAVAKAYGISHTGKELKASMLEISQPWRPYRSYASRLLWRWLDS
jgi:DNA-3-methyladenine glycosylase II